MARREFTKAVQVAIIKRATALSGDLGAVRCERCGLFLTRWEIHHKDQDALQVDKSRKLTPDDGELLCIPCHKEVTKAQAPVLAKALRREAAHLGVKSNKAKIPSRPKAPKEQKPRFVSETRSKSEIYRRFANEAE